MSLDVDLNKTLMRALKNVGLWKELSEVISDELNNLKSEMEYKRKLFNSELLANENDVTNLIELANFLGFTPDRSLNETITFLQTQVDNIEFKRRYKTTYLSYNLSFHEINREGEVFILYWNGEKIIRPPEDWQTTIAAQDPTEPYKFIAEKNYNDFSLGTIEFDDTPVEKFDDADPWLFDQESLRVTTKHLAVELYLDQTVTNDNSEEVLIYKDYFEYINNFIFNIKKAIEVPHVGCQLTFIVDNTTFFDSATGASTYSMPNLKVKSALTDQYSVPTVPQYFAEMCVGTGTQSLPSKNDAVPSYPSSLANEVSCMPLHVDEVEIESSWILVHTMIQGNTIDGEVIGTGDGSDQFFVHTISSAPLNPISVRITWTSNGNFKEARSNLSGDILADYATGSIDYTSGYLSLFTYKDTINSNEVAYSGTVTNLTYTTNEDNVQANTFSITYTIASTEYTASDDGAGNISGTGISSGSIIYATGVVSITFSSPTDIYEFVTVDYTSREEATPDSSTDVLISYSLNSELDITECGIKDSSGNLIAYATFPKIQFSNIKYHIGFQWFIKKGTF